MKLHTQIVGEAAALLSEYGISQPPVDVRALAEAQGIAVVYEDMEDSVSGFLIKRDDATIIGVNAGHHLNRQRFTLAHEIGHYKLHPNSPTVYVDDAMVHFRGADIYDPSDQSEVAANAFAAALLMPEPFLKSDVAGKRVDISDESAVRKLAQRYQVSAQALTIRLMELGLLGGVQRLEPSAK